ncbi:protein containing transglutaminase-like domain [Klebsiella pneumoniae]|uniref:Protein containing transglutaminase-like domain n=1 Tax=Klebsiella pneumoniae TaxID=573 RepID=A0A2X1SJZ5_KLEPN|nr:protein containing transglutaminase-like domain [Klebsiella pneumoniae]
MKLVIDHLTRYGYDEEVKFSTQYLRLTPRSTARQTITAWTLTLPDGAAVTTTDGWGNVLHVLTLDNPHKEITIRASGIVDIADEGEETRDEEAELLSPLVFLRCTPLTRADTAIREFAQRLYRPDAAEESLNQLMADLLLRMPYSPGATQVQDSAADAFARAKGVCQDHTHVFLACCARWRSRRATSAAMSTAITPSMWRCMPGRKSGSTAAGCRLISPIIPVA